MAKFEVLDSKRAEARRSRPVPAARTSPSRLGWKPQVLRIRELTQHAPHAPRVVPVYWDPHFLTAPGDVAAFDELLRALFRSSWMTELSQYGVAPAQLLPSFVAKEPPRASLSQADLQEQLIEWLASETVMPRPSKAERALLYLLITPLATKLTLGSLTSAKDFSGYHDFTEFASERGPRATKTAAKNLFYAAVPLKTTSPNLLDAHSRAISGELAAAFVDRSRWLRDHQARSKRRPPRADP